MKGNANPVHQDKEGYTALHNACARGYLDMAQFLVSQGVPVDARSRLGHTSLSKLVTSSTFMLFSL